MIWWNILEHGIPLNRYVVSQSNKCRWIWNINKLLRRKFVSESAVVCWVDETNTDFYYQFFPFQVWDSCSDALITFNHDNFIGDIAYIVENDVLLHSILKELEPSTNITIRNDAKIEHILLERDGLPFGKVQLATGENFTAELLVRNFYSKLFHS